jgi:hypothetical protein
MDADQESSERERERERHGVVDSSHFAHRVDTARNANTIQTHITTTVLILSLNVTCRAYYTDVGAALTR